MRLTYKYRLFPTNAQKTAMTKALDACRWVYNKTLETRKNAYEERQESLSRYTTIKMIPIWKTQNEYLNNAYSQSLQESCTRVDLAFKAFFRRVKAGDKPGYPRFRSYNRYDSFAYPQVGFKLLDNSTLRLSKIGDVKIKIHRNITGIIKTLTIRRDRLDNWYACFSCEVEPKPLPVIDKVVGIDFGLTTFATMSDGSKIERQRWMQKEEKRLAKIQRKVSSLNKGTPKRRKSVKALNHIHQSIANRRRDFSHKESRKLVNKYQLIVFEKLNINGMQNNTFKTITRGITDVAWNQFVQFTKYKAVCAGRTEIEVNPKGTSQDCSGCGVKVPKDLSVRIHDCPHCGLVIDRDLNASFNILARGLACLERSALRSPRL